MQSAFTSLQSVEHYFICSCCSCNISHAVPHISFSGCSLHHCMLSHISFMLFHVSALHAVPCTRSCCFMCQLFMLFHGTVHAVPYVSWPTPLNPLPVNIKESMSPAPCGSGFGVPPPPTHTYVSPHIWLTADTLQIPVLAPSVLGAISDPYPCPPSTLHSLSPPPPFLSLHFSSEEYCASFSNYPKQSPPQSANCVAVWTVPPFGVHRAWHGAGTPQVVEQGADGTNEHKEPPSPDLLGGYAQSRRGQSPLAVAGVGSPNVTSRRWRTSSTTLGSSGLDWRHSSPSFPTA